MAHKKSKLHKYLAVLMLFSVSIYAEKDHSSKDKEEAKSNPVKGVRNLLLEAPKDIEIRKSIGDIAYRIIYGVDCIEHFKNSAPEKSKNYHYLVENYLQILINHQQGHQAPPFDMGEIKEYLDMYAKKACDSALQEERQKTRCENYWTQRVYSEDFPKASFEENAPEKILEFLKANNAKIRDSLKIQQSFCGESFNGSSGKAAITPEIARSFLDSYKAEKRFNFKEVLRTEKKLESKVPETPKTAPKKPKKTEGFVLLEKKNPPKNTPHDHAQGTSPENLQQKAHTTEDENKEDSPPIADTETTKITKKEISAPKKLEEEAPKDQHKELFEWKAITVQAPINKENLKEEFNNFNRSVLDLFYCSALGYSSAELLKHALRGVFNDMAQNSASTLSGKYGSDLWAYLDHFHKKRLNAGTNDSSTVRSKLKREMQAVLLGPHWGKKEIKKEAETLKASGVGFIFHVAKSNNLQEVPFSEEAVNRLASLANDPEVQAEIQSNKISLENSEMAYSARKCEDLSVLSIRKTFPEYTTESFSRRESARQIFDDFQKIYQELAPEYQEVFAPSFNNESSAEDFIKLSDESPQKLNSIQETIKAIQEHHLSDKSYLSEEHENETLALEEEFKAIDKHGVSDFTPRPKLEKVVVHPHVFKDYMLPERRDLAKAQIELGDAHRNNLQIQHLAAVREMRELPQFQEALEQAAFQELKEEADRLAERNKAPFEGYLNENHALSIGPKSDFIDLVRIQDEFAHGVVRSLGCDDQSSDISKLHRILHLGYRLAKTNQPSRGFSFQKYKEGNLSGEFISICRSLSKGSLTKFNNCIDPKKGGGLSTFYRLGEIFQKDLPQNFSSQWGNSEKTNAWFTQQFQQAHGFSPLEAAPFPRTPLAQEALELSKTLINWSEDFAREAGCLEDSFVSTHRPLGPMYVHHSTANKHFLQGIHIDDDDFPINHYSKSNGTINNSLHDKVWRIFSSKIKQVEREHGKAAAAKFRPTSCFNTPSNFRKLLLTQAYCMGIGMNDPLCKSNPTMFSMNRYFDHDVRGNKSGWHRVDYLSEKNGALYYKPMAGNPKGTGATERYIMQNGDSLSERDKLNLATRFSYFLRLPKNESNYNFSQFSVDGKEHIEFFKPKSHKTQLLMHSSLNNIGGDLGNSNREIFTHTSSYENSIGRLRGDKRYLATSTNNGGAIQQGPDRMRLFWDTTSASQSWLNKNYPVKALQNLAWNAPDVAMRTMLNLQKLPIDEMIAHCGADTTVRKPGDHGTQASRSSIDWLRSRYGKLKNCRAKGYSVSNMREYFSDTSEGRVCFYEWTTLCPQFHLMVNFMQPNAAFGPIKRGEVSSKRCENVFQFFLGVGKYK